MVTLRYSGCWTVMAMGEALDASLPQDIAQHTLIHKERLALQGQDIWNALEKHQSGEHQSPQDDDRYLEAILSPHQRQQLWRLHDQRFSPARLVGIDLRSALPRLFARCDTQGRR